MTVRPATTLIAIAAIVASTAMLSAQGQGTPIVIRASTVLDGKGKVLSNVSIVIEGSTVHSPGLDGDDDREAADAENENHHHGGHGDDDHDRVAKERYALRVTVDGSRLQID